MKKKTMIHTFVYIHTYMHTFSLLNTMFSFLISTSSTTSYSQSHDDDDLHIDLALLTMLGGCLNIFFDVVTVIIVYEVKDVHS